MCRFKTAACILSAATHKVELLYYHMYIEAPLCVSFMNCSMSPRCCKVQHCSTFQTNPQSESSILSHIYRGFTLWVGLELQHVCQVLQVKYCSTLHSKPTNKVKAGIYTCNSIEASLCWLVKLSRKVQSVH